MSLTDTEIHRAELLLTLDYLLKYTNEKHPATQQNICKYATTFGLKYDPNNTVGNDVKRQRIKDCLEYLKKLTTEFPDRIPFVLETTPKGKFYIEQKWSLNNEQVTKILAAILNDKYTIGVETDFLVDRVLDTYTNSYNRDKIKNDASALAQTNVKANSDFQRNFRLLNKAYKEKKNIAIIYDMRLYCRFLNGEFTTNDGKAWCRVYALKEYNNQIYAVLIPISKIEDNGVFRSRLTPIICKPVALLDIPNDKDSEVIIPDFIPNRNLNKLFIKNCSKFGQEYQSIDDYLKQAVFPTGTSNCYLSMSFRADYLKYVKFSFENYFATKLDYVLCYGFNVEPISPRIYYKKSNQGNDNFPKYPLKPILTPKTNKQKAFLVVVNMVVNKNSVKKWILSDTRLPLILKIEAPKSLNSLLENYYLKMALIYRKYSSRAFELNYIDKKDTTKSVKEVKKFTSYDEYDDFEKNMYLNLLNNFDL